jgi:hypothetical protein
MQHAVCAVMVYCTVNRHHSIAAATESTTLEHNCVAIHALTTDATKQSQRALIDCMRNNYSITDCVLMILRTDTCYCLLRCCFNQHSGGDRLTV